MPSVPTGMQPLVFSHGWVLVLYWWCFDAGPATPMENWRPLPNHVLAIRGHRSLWVWPSGHTFTEIDYGCAENFINQPSLNAGGGSLLQRIHQEKSFKEPRRRVFQDSRCGQQVCPSVVSTCTFDQRFMFIRTDLFMRHCEGMPSTTQERVFLSKRWAVSHIRKNTFFGKFLKVKSLKQILCILFLWVVTKLVLMIRFFVFLIARRDCSRCEDLAQCICGR